MSSSNVPNVATVSQIKRKSATTNQQQDIRDLKKQVKELSTTCISLSSQVRALTEDIEKRNKKEEAEKAAKKTKSNPLDKMRTTVNKRCRIIEASFNNTAANKWDFSTSYKGNENNSKVLEALISMCKEDKTIKDIFRVTALTENESSEILTNYFSNRFHHLRNEFMKAPMTEQQRIDRNKKNSSSQRKSRLRKNRRDAYENNKDLFDIYEVDGIDTFLKYDYMSDEEDFRDEHGTKKFKRSIPSYRTYTANRIIQVCDEIHKERCKSAEPCERVVSITKITPRNVDKILPKLPTWAYSVIE